MGRYGATWETAFDFSEERILAEFDLSLRRLQLPWVEQIISSSFLFVQVLSRVRLTRVKFAKSSCNLIGDQHMCPSQLINICFYCWSFRYVDLVQIHDFEFAQVRAMFNHIITWEGMSMRLYLPMRIVTWQLRVTLDSICNFWDVIFMRMDKTKRHEQ